MWAERLPIWWIMLSTACRASEAYIHGGLYNVPYQALSLVSRVLLALVLAASQSLVLRVLQTPVKRGI